MISVIGRIKRQKKEPDGTIRYKSRIVSKGYMQISGVDYTERYSPVANDTTTRLVILICLYNGWLLETIDIEAAFLEGDIDEAGYME